MLGIKGAKLRLRVLHNIKEAAIGSSVKFWICIMKFNRDSYAGPFFSARRLARRVYNTVDRKDQQSDYKIWVQRFCENISWTCGALAMRRKRSRKPVLPSIKTLVIVQTFFQTPYLRCQFFFTRSSPVCGVLFGEGPSSRARPPACRLWWRGVRSFYGTWAEFNSPGFCLPEAKLSCTLHALSCHAPLTAF